MLPWCKMAHGRGVLNTEGKCPLGVRERSGSCRVRLGFARQARGQVVRPVTGQWPCGKRYARVDESIEAAW